MIYDDIAPYVDGNGLVSNRIVPTGVKRDSDNGVLHTSRYLILEKLTCNITNLYAFICVESCVDDKGYLHRAPDDPTQNAPDDHYGLLSMLLVLGYQDVKLSLPWACCHPMLLYMRGLTGPFSALWQLFSPVAAAIIYFSNMGSPASETSDRLLTWNIIQGLKGNPLTRLAGRLWLDRQRSLYGSTQVMSAIYYGLDHPITKYWVD